MKKLMVALCVLVGCVSAWAGVKTWTGSGSGWSDAASWDPEGVPAAADTVVFNASAEVTPDASFAGVVSVTAGTLTMTSAENLSLALAVKTGATFAKAGAGSMTIRPATAFEFSYATGGDISVLEGSVTFNGNGRDEAPGYFGALTVAEGASVTVANAPVADRHGVVTRMPAYDASAYAEFRAYFTDRAEVCKRWAAAASGNCRFYDPIAEGDGAFSGSTVIPSGYTPSSTWVIYATRGVQLAPGGYARITGRGNQSNAVIFDGGELTPNSPTQSLYGNQWMSTPLPQAIGWTAHDDFFETTNEKPTRYGYANVRPEFMSGMIGVNEMWNGVCFRGITVASGATLTIAAGQSLAVADGGAVAFNGTFAGGSDTLFAIMGGEAAPDWTKFANFAGTLEVGGYATLAAAGTDFSNQPFTLASRGVVVVGAGTAGLTAENCTGTVDIPSGVTFAADAALLKAVRVTGPGTVATTEAVGADEIDVSAETTLQFGDGAAVAIPTSLVSVGRKAQSIVLDKQTWDMRAYVSPGEGRSCDECKIHDDGTARLVYQPWQLCGMWFDKQFVEGDRLDLSFEVATSRPEGSAGGYAEGWGVKFNPEKTYSGRNTMTPDKGFGFDMYSWLGYTFRWQQEGYFTEDVINLGNAPYSYERDKPVACRVGLTNNVMTVTVSQEGKPSFTASRAFPGLFRDNQKMYVGITAATGSGDIRDKKVSSNFFVADVGKLSGTAECAYSPDFSDTPDPKSLVTSNSWSWVNNMCCTNENEINLYKEAVGGKNGAAVNTNKFDATIPFLIKFDYVIDWVRAGGYAAEGPAISFQDKTTTPNTGVFSGSGMLFKVDNCVGLWRHYYAGYSKLQVRNSNDNGTTAEECYWATQRSELGEVTHVSLEYDGSSRLTSVEERVRGSEVKTCTMSHCFDQFATYTDGFYVGFGKAGGYSDSYVLARIKNFGLYRTVANANRTVDTPVTVAEGATATVSTATVVAEPTGGVTLADVSLASGATLALDPAKSAGWLGLGSVTSAAGATVASASGLTTMFDKIVLTGETGSALTVTGAWDAKDGKLTVVVPAAWKGSFEFLKIDPSKYVGAGDDPVITVVDENGKVIRGNVRRTVDGYGLARPGMTVIFY